MSSLTGQPTKVFYHFITKFSGIVLKKKESSFCSVKASHNFSTKYVGGFQILLFEILTKCLLATLLVLNNRTLTFSVFVQRDTTFVTLFASLDDENITNIDLVLEKRIVPRSKMSFL